jgi:hypothetical protein
MTSEDDEPGELSPGGRPIRLGVCVMQKKQVKLARLLAELRQGADLEIVLSLKTRSSRRRWSSGRWWTCSSPSTRAASRWTRYAFAQSVRDTHVFARSPDTSFAYTRVAYTRHSHTHA